MNHPEPNFPMIPIEENPVFDWIARFEMMRANSKLAQLARALEQHPLSEPSEELDAFISIERQAMPLVKEGWQPVDSEPGEWLVMQHPDTEDTIVITPNI